MAATAKNLTPKVETGSAEAENGLKKSRALSIAIQQYADELLEQDLPDNALTALSVALIADPGRVGSLHKMGKCLEALGESEDAIDCFRGGVPESINRRFFNSDDLSSRVKDVADCVQVVMHYAHATESIELKAPVRNATQGRYNQFNFGKTQARGTFCTEASDGAIWFDGYNTIALDSDGNIIREHMMGNEFACYPAIQKTRATKIDGTVCFLDARSSSIYYHWMIDVLPKIGVLENAGFKLEEIDYFVVKTESRYQRESLRLLGISEDRIISAAGHQYFSADKMLVPFLLNSPGERIYYGLGVGIGSWIPAFLSKQFAPAMSAVDKKSRVYISRSTRGSRNIANESEIKDVLHARRFKTVEFESLSIPEQAELMLNSEVVVGVHGAGFTNLSFCQAGTKVVEIFGDYVVPCYWALCAVAKLDYWQFMADSESEGTDADNPGARVTSLRDSQIVVDAQEFAEYLDTILD